MAFSSRLKETKATREKMPAVVPRHKHCCLPSYLVELCFERVRVKREKKDRERRALRDCLDLTRIPFTGVHIYAPNNPFPKGFIQVKVLKNDNLYVRVDLPGVREYSGSAGLGCDCCEITGVDAKFKDGFLRITVSRVKVKDHEKKCTLTGKSGRYMEEHPFVVKGRKRAFFGESLVGDGGLYFAFDVPGACANETQIRFYAKVKNVCEHDESGRTYMGCVNSRSSSSIHASSILTQTLAYDDLEYGVLKILIAPSRNKTNNE